MHVERLQRVIEGNYTHRYYDRTVALAKLYRQIVTTEQQGELVIAYKPSESEKQKEQRLEIYKSKTKEVTSQIKSQFHVVKGASRTTDTIEYVKGQRATDEQKINAAVSRFYGRQTLQQYIDEKALHYAFIDPNAWMVIKPFFDPQTADFKPMPTIYESEAALDYETIGGITDYLITVEKVSSEVVYYYYFSAGIQVVAVKGRKLERESIGTIGEYALYQFNNETSETAAMRFGYVPDDATDGYTYIGVLDPVTNSFIDLINAKAELDLTRNLHVFLKKYQFVDACDGRDIEEPHYLCSGGMLRNHAGLSKGMCTKCKGKGHITHISSQDVILVKKPSMNDPMTDATAKPMPLSEIEHYSTMPFEIVDHQAENVAKLAKDIPKYIFGVDLETRSSGLKTATEINSFYESVYATIMPFAEKISEMYIFCTVAMAQMMGIAEGLIVSHKYPRSFKMETLADLLVMLKDAKASGASSEIVWGIEMQIAEIQNRDNPAALQLMKIKRKFQPFKELSESERMQQIASLSPENKYAILHAYSDVIFARIMLANPNFIMFPESRQNQIVDDAVNVLKAEITEPVITLELETDAQA